MKLEGVLRTREQKFKRVHWRYLRLLTSHETKHGSVQLTDHRIAKVPWDFMRRLGPGDALFDTLFDLYRKRYNKTIGVRETLKIIRVSEVTKALTK